MLIAKQYAYRGAELIVIPQPDGSIACIPSWMTHESAAHHQLRAEPRLSLEALRSLRSEIDALLSFLQSDSRMEKASNEAQGVRREWSQARQARPAAPIGRVGRAAQGSARGLYLLERVRAEPARDCRQCNGQRRHGQRGGPARRVVAGWASALRPLRSQDVCGLWRQSGALLLPGRSREPRYGAVHLVRRLARR